jgi:hypothetical protein
MDGQMEDRMGMIEEDMVRIGTTNGKMIFQPFAIDGTDVNVHAIISKLKFISKLEAGEKVASDGKATLSVIPDTKWYNILRTFGYGSGSKESTLEFIKHTTDNALEIAKKCFSSQDLFHHRIAHLIVASLKEADIGIQNISQTYESDRWFVSKMDTFRQLLDAKINSLVLDSTQV